MSRNRSRARDRHARDRREPIQMTRAELEEKRKDPEAFAELLSRIAASDLCVWAIERLITLDECERAMAAQTVAPRLAGMTPGSVHRRHEFLRRTRSATEQDAGGAGEVSGLRPEC